MDLIVYSHYYRTRTPDRQNEIDECLRRNLNRPGISRMVLFCESDAPSVPEGTVEVANSDQRITDAECLCWKQRQSFDLGLPFNSDDYLARDLGTWITRIYRSLRADAEAPISVLNVSSFPLGLEYLPQLHLPQAEGKLRHAYPICTHLTESRDLHQPQRKVHTQIILP